MENSIEVSENVKNWTVIWSSNLTCEYLFKENKSTNVKRYMKSNVCCSAIYSSQEVEATEGSANRWMNKQNVVRVSVQFSSLAQSCPTLCDPMDCSTPGFPVHHQLPELAQTHVHRVGDAIQPSHPLLSTSPLTFNLSGKASGSFQMSWFFTSGGQSTGVSASASVDRKSVV